jgi:hypothetical protein
MDDRHEFQEEWPLEDVVITDVKVCNFKHQHLLALIVSCSIGHLEVDAHNRSGQLSWDDPMECLMYRCQVRQIEPHLDEGLPHYKI